MWCQETYLAVTNRSSFIHLPSARYRAPWKGCPSHQEGKMPLPWFWSWLLGFKRETQQVRGQPFPGDKPPRAELCQRRRWGEKHRGGWRPAAWAGAVPVLKEAVDRHTALSQPWGTVTEFIWGHRGNVCNLLHPREPLNIPELRGDWGKGSTPTPLQWHSRQGDREKFAFILSFPADWNFCCSKSGFVSVCSQIKSSFRV